MSELLSRHWQAQVVGGGLSRRDSRSCDYAAYVPDRLAGRGFALYGDVAADVSDAEAANMRLNAGAKCAGRHGIPRPHPASSGGRGFVKDRGT